MVLVRIFVVLRKLELGGIVVVVVGRTLVVQRVLGGNVVLHILVRSHLVRIPFGIVVVVVGRTLVVQRVLGGNVVPHILVRSHLVRIPFGILVGNLFGILVLDG